MKTVKFLDQSGYSRVGSLKDGKIHFGDRALDPDEVTFLPPCEPSKIVCVGRNYTEHAAERGAEVPERPKLFLKPPNTITAHGRTVKLPFPDNRYDPEAELAVVIDRQAREVRAEDAFDYIGGFTCMNDLTNRTDQETEENWVRGKAFDNAAPLGPVLVEPEHVPENALIRSRVNGELRQRTRMDQMIFPVPDLIEEITKHLTLEAGDVVATGTPEGIAPLNHGDTVEVEIEGIGRLRNEIRFDSNETAG